MDWQMKGVNSNVSVHMRCSCGNDIDTTIIHNGDDYYMAIPPCNVCCNKAFHAGYKEGYDRHSQEIDNEGSFDVGHDTGYKLGYKDGFENGYNCGLKESKNR